MNQDTNNNHTITYVVLILVIERFTVPQKTGSGKERF